MNVLHPCCLLPPKVGKNLAPFTMALGALATIMILQTARQARDSIGVCQTLIGSLRNLGVQASKLHTLSSAVDLEHFLSGPRDQASAWGALMQAHSTCRHAVA